MLVALLMPVHHKRGRLEGLIWRLMIVSVWLIRIAIIAIDVI